MPRMIATLDDLMQGCGEWLRGEGPENDIVISTRIRLARNLADFPFTSIAAEADRKQILERVKDVVAQSPFRDHVLYLDVDKLSELDRHFLVERQLISRELAEGQGPRGVFIDHAERFSIMINEEDHLRIQAVQSGFQLDATWNLINRWDDYLDEHLVFAYDEEWGFLTACPTNVGTGMRVSVMLHLPASVITRQMDQTLRSLEKLELVVRGLYGEGSQAMGDFYQVSNQVTLGRSEADLIGKMAQVVPAIVAAERKAREFLLAEGQESVHDRVSRAYGILKTAQTISAEETLHLLSSVRMGIHLGLIQDVPVKLLNELFLYTQPAHLQKLAGTELDSSDRNIERARFLRKKLGELEKRN